MVGDKMEPEFPNEPMTKEAASNDPSVGLRSLGMSHEIVALNCPN